MNKKFAVVEYIKEVGEIPLKYKILRRAPGFIMDWYIRKFNPYTIEDIERLGEKGIYVKLPITKEQAVKDAENAARLLELTMQDLRDYGVAVVLPGEGIQISDANIRIADGVWLFPFFIMDSILKALKIMNKSVKTAEILIIDGDREITLALLDGIYPHVNYLAVISEFGQEGYQQKVDEVFENTGLNLRVAEKSSSLHKNADIVINTSPQNPGSAFAYKRGAIYFELCADSARIKELCAKREDMLIVDDLRISVMGQFFSLKYLEAIMFVRSRRFRSLLNRGYEQPLAAEFEKELSSLDVNISAFFCSNTLLTSIKLAKILSRAGIDKEDSLRYNH